jgi:hypothetical protein
LRLVVWLALGVAGAAWVSYERQADQPEQFRNLTLRQFENDDAVPRALRQSYWQRETAIAGGIVGWAFLGFLLFSPEITCGVNSLRDGI